jgi:hypothetical protein
MHTLGDMAAALNRAPVYVRGLQARFQLPPFEGPRYSDAYLAFLRVLVALRILGISEDALRDLWQFEKKLLQVLHVDSAGSRTWFLDSCGQTAHPERRLLLTHHDLGVALPSGTLQLGLDFSASLPELFPGREMGEDALRLLRECLSYRARMLGEVAAELPHVRAAIAWAAPLTKRVQQTAS